jgi:hypothetical protein
MPGRIDGGGEKEAGKQTNDEGQHLARRKWQCRESTSRETKKRRRKNGGAKQRHEALNEPSGSHAGISGEKRETTP